MKKYKLSIVGSGSLGSIIGRVVTQNLSNEYDILGIYSRRIENATKLANQINTKAYTTLDEMIDDQPDYIIEAASPDVFRDIGIKILSSGINVIPLSVGALADKEFYSNVKQTALENNSRVHIPAGAVGGFDALRASMLMEDAEVEITTEKSPESLAGAPILKGKALSEENVEEVFSGYAKEAIKHFPENVNVAVATALATTGIDNTKVSVHSIPGFESNRHEINLIGETVNVTITVETTPSKENPKSSTLAAYSVISLLQNLVSPVTF